MVAAAILAFCSQLQVAHLSSSVSCRVSFKQAPHTTVCFPEEIWKKWLIARQAGVDCANLQGAWSAHSPTSNDLNHSRSKINERSSLSLFSRVIGRLEKFRLQVSDALRDSDSTGVIRSFILGESAANDTRELLRYFGFVHLLAAGGIQLWIICQIFQTIFKGVCLRVGFSPDSTRVVRYLLTGGIWLFIWSLSGMRPGMLRPWGILIIRQIFQYLGIKANIFFPIAGVILIELAARLLSRQPFSGQELFPAVGYALAITGAILGKSHFKMCVGAWVFVSILEAMQSGSISIFTPLISLITLPVVGFVGFPALIGAAIWQNFSFLQWLSHAFNAWIILLLRIASYLPSVWFVDRSALYFGFFISLIYFYRSSFGPGVYERKRTNWVFVIFFVVILLGRNISLIHHVFSSEKAQQLALPAKEVIQLDVGQGDSALILGQNQIGLIDAGKEVALSSTAWLKIFSQHQITRLNWVALSHLDEDHSGGLKKLASLIEMNCVVTAQGELNTTRGQRYAKLLAESGIAIRNWESGCVPYPYYSPDTQEPGRSRAIAKSRKNQHMGGVVVPLESGGVYINFGDAEKNDEIKMSHWASKLDALARNPRIFKISHHGSATSSEEEVLLSIKPTITWISVGSGNHFGHPALSVLQRLNQLNIPWQRTDLKGARSSLNLEF